jgi:hypothetical protein
MNRTVKMALMRENVPVRVEAPVREKAPAPTREEPPAPIEP